MSLTEDYALRRTNVSRPRLSQSNSFVSITASEDFYSLNGDDAASRLSVNNQDHDRNDFLQPPQRFTTPPSRFHTPDDERLPLNPEPSQRRIDQHPATVAFDDVTINRALRRKPVGSPPSSPQNQTAYSEQAEQKSLRSLKPGSAMESERVSPTPGLDDTPYIRFAIDQLTRDEEVRGSRHYPARESAEMAGPSSDAGISAVAPATADPFEDDDDYPVDRIVPDEGLGYMDQQREREAADMARRKEYAAGPPPRHPLQPVYLSQPLLPPATPPSVGREQYDVFVPYVPTVYTHQTPRLNFLPGILRPVWMGLYIFLCLLMLVGLIFCAVWSSKHNGLWDYQAFGDGRYFIFEYFPMILGMIILLWLFQIQIAIQRIAPFMAMASDSSKPRSEGAFLSLYPSHFLLPRIQYFRSGQPIFGACSIIFWAFLFSIPLLAAAFNVRYAGSDSATSWRWVAVEGVIWTVIALYIPLILTLIALAAVLLRSTTGLKWDPRSLADIIALLERANIMNDYSGSEAYANLGEFKQRLWNRSDRLGYWITSRRGQDVFYGLGEEGGPTRRYSVEQGRIREKPRVSHSAQSSVTSLGEIHAASDYHIRSDLRSTNMRRRYVPWYLSNVAILVWLALAFALLLAFLVVAFVDRATLGGFVPLLSAGAGTGGFSSANFLYSFIPCVIGMLVFLLYQPLDYTNRRLAAFSVMSGSTGASAEHSLLLDYPYAFPGVVTITALSNRHWKVAILSLVNLVNITIPILSGGIFWAQWYPSAQEVRIAAQPAGIYALCFFLALYAVSLLVLLPGRRSLRLPHGSTSLAELISWLYMSPLLVDRAFVRCNSKAELVARLTASPLPHHPHDRNLKPKRSFWASVTSIVSAGKLGSGGHRSPYDSKSILPQHYTSLAATSDPSNRPPTASGDGYRLSAVPEATAVPPRDRAFRADAFAGAEQVRYGFGVYLGRDGREHLGIDRVKRGGREMVIA